MIIVNDLQNNILITVAASLPVSAHLDLVLVLLLDMVDPIPIMARMFNPTLLVTTITIQEAFQKPLLSQLNKLSLSPSPNLLSMSSQPRFECLEDLSSLYFNRWK